MTADLLHRAATLIRERAEAVDDRDYSKRIVAKVGRRTPAGQHIAGMSPAVAVAVAALLEFEVEDAEWHDATETAYSPTTLAAIAVARVYLGADA